MSDFPDTPAHEPQLPPPIVAPPAVVLTDNALTYLNQTRPWVRFMSILTFCMVGFMVVLGGIIILMGTLGRSLLEASGGNFSLLGAIATGFFYSLISLVYVAPAIYLHRYAGAIGRLQAGPSEFALEEALRNQKSFWRYVGILSVIGIALTVLVFVGAIILIILGVAMGRGR